MDFSPEGETVSKVTWRLIPLLFLIAYIDRINVGFAGLQLQRAFGVDIAQGGKSGAPAFEIEV